MTTRLLLIGFGTVGQGLAELVLAKGDEIARAGGPTLRVTGISDTLKGSLYDPRGIDLEETLAAAAAGTSIAGPGQGFEGDALEMIRTAEADMVVEATYTDLETGEPGTSHIRAALERGLDVTTTNKGPIALHLRELSELARERGARLLYEGTVMSGTPLLNLIRENLAGSRISEIRGILNGTTNYILTRMEEGLDYGDALAEAQELGYAEAVPDADVLGRDALAKVTILANSVFGAQASPADFPCQGITGIGAADVEAARARGRRYKLIGRVWRQDDEVRGSVEPVQVDLAHPLAGVSGATNAATLATDTLGEITVVGPGAGRRETGYSALIDILAATRRRT